jgi:hypothetical protein
MVLVDCNIIKKRIPTENITIRATRRNEAETRLEIIITAAGKDTSRARPSSQELYRCLLVNANDNMDEK